MKSPGNRSRLGISRSTWHRDAPALRRPCKGRTIYATSIDYDPSAEASQKFFAAIQNKMHWAAHGHTAAEIIAQRADARQPNN